MLFYLITAQYTEGEKQNHEVVVIAATYLCLWQSATVVLLLDHVVVLHQM